MSDEQAFLNAIAADPEDDTPRLVFADWLQEHGDDDRAEFIRVQCRRSAAAADSAEWYELSRRERELLLAHRDEWWRELPADPERGWSWGSFERGFVPSLSVADWDRVEPRAGELLAAQPVERLFLWQTHSDQPRRVGECERLRSVKELALSRSVDAGDFLRAVADSPHLAGLKRFSARNAGAGTPLASSLRRSGAFPRLTRMELEGFNRSTSGNSIGLFFARHWPDLTELTLRRYVISPAPPLDSPVLRRLRRLELQDAIDDHHFAAIADFREPLPLRSLVISETSLGESGARALTATGLFGNLDGLDLRRCHLGADAVSRLGRASFWPNLTSLSLEDNPFGDPGLAALAGTDPPPGLRRLDLDGVGWTDLRPLAGWRGLASVEMLRLMGNAWPATPTLPGADDGLVPLLESPHVGRLGFLKLRRCGLTSEAARRLAAAPWLGQLHALDLGENRIDAEGVKALVGTPKAANLRRLSLDRNPIGRAGVRALLDSPHLERLCVLHLPVEYRGFSSTLRRQMAQRFGAAVIG